MADRDKYLEMINKIGTVEDEAERRELLNSFREDITKLVETEEGLEKTVNTYKEDNEKLRQANMKLFLQVGEQKTPEQELEDKTGVHKEDEKPKRKFEDLFNEKGRLK